APTLNEPVPAPSSGDGVQGASNNGTGVVPEPPSGVSTSPVPPPVRVDTSPQRLPAELRSQPPARAPEHPEPPRVPEARRETLGGGGAADVPAPVAAPSRATPVPPPAPQPDVSAPPPVQTTTVREEAVRPSVASEPAPAVRNVSADTVPQTRDIETEVR